MNSGCGQRRWAEDVDGGEAGVVVDDKDHPVRIIFVTDHFFQGFLSWYLSGLFYTGINDFRLVISC